MNFGNSFLRAVIAAILTFIADQTILPLFAYFNPGLAHYNDFSLRVFGAVLLFYAIVGGVYLIAISFLLFTALPSWYPVWSDRQPHFWRSGLIGTVFTFLLSAIVSAIITYTAIYVGSLEPRSSTNPSQQVRTH